MTVAELTNEPIVGMIFVAIIIAGFTFALVYKIKANQ